jgi:4-alpha-glucanotransferase
MHFTRSSGILMHPTSLPGKYGVGEIGPEAYRFVDFLEKSGQSLWQILPIGPTGYGDSPYASFSTFAGNPLFISLDILIEEGVLNASDLADVPDFPRDKVDFGWVQYWKFPKLNFAAENFLAHATKEQNAAFQTFLKEEKAWLEDYALFMAVKGHFQKIADEKELFGKMWSNFWDKDIALKEPEAVKKWSKKLAKDIKIHKVLQFFFYSQWSALKTYANDKGIKLIGDIPIFVAGDSVDVWANKELFFLDQDGQQTVQAGVPPDYFSATGQLWGNPLYNWEAMEAHGFKWWLTRIKGMLKMVDILRIDHFRGFEGYWEIKASEKTAINGQWVKAPGMALFKKIKKSLGKLPIIAEDLGVITPEVEELRDAFEFPGMKILQFAFDASEAGASGDNGFLPHNYTPNSVVYTGTHDNDTSRGWYDAATEGEKAYVKKYLKTDDGSAVWDFIRAAIASVSDMAVVPMQDLLNIGSEGRMNIPSTLGGNWEWRFFQKDLSDDLANSLKDLTKMYGRLPKDPQEK